MKRREGGGKDLSVTQREGDNDCQEVVAATVKGRWKQTKKGGRRERSKGPNFGSLMN